MAFLGRSNTDGGISWRLGFERRKSSKFYHQYLLFDLGWRNSSINLSLYQFIKVNQSICSTRSNPRLHLTIPKYATRLSPRSSNAHCIAPHPSRFPAPTSISIHLPPPHVMGSRNPGENITHSVMRLYPGGICVCDKGDPGARMGPLEGGRSGVVARAGMALWLPLAIDGIKNRRRGCAGVGSWRQVDVTRQTGQTAWRRWQFKDKVYQCMICIMYFPTKHTHTFYIQTPCSTSGGLSQNIHNRPGKRKQACEIR